MQMRTGLSILLLVVCGAGHAQSVTLREDIRDGRKPSFTFSLVVPNGVRMWGLGANTAAPVWDFGWVTPKPIHIADHLTMLAGGYVSYWRGEKNVYVEPWTLTCYQQGRWSTSMKLSLYVPLTGSGWKLYSDHAESSYRLTPRWSIGIATGDAWLISGRKPRMGIGATTTIRMGTCTINARALYGLNEPNSLRLEATMPF